MSNFGKADSTLPYEFKEREKFVCLAYSSKGPTTLPNLRWKIFRTKNLEGELLPLTISTLLPHIQRTNYICARDKSYFESKPTLPRLEENGWIFKDGSYESVRCVSLPAPKAVLELVKCEYKQKCVTKCSCMKNNLSCTALCKCFALGCNNSYRFQKNHDETQLEDEELFE